MVYSVLWDNATPIGATTAAADLDTELQNLKISIQERMDDLIGAGNWANNAVEPKILTVTVPTFVRAGASLLGVINETKFTGWATQEDADGLYDVPTDNFIIATTGVYLITANWRSTLAADANIAIMEIKKNGSTSLKQSLHEKLDQTSPFAITNDHNVSFVITLTAADTIQCFGSVFGGAGGTLTVQLSISKMN